MFVSTAQVPGLGHGRNSRQQGKIYNLFHIKKLQNGGESGIRTLPTPLDSVTYRFHNARVAVDARVAVAPCTGLHRARGERDGNSGALRSWNRCAINASLVEYRNVEFRFLRSGTGDEIESDTSTDSNRTRRRVRDARANFGRKCRSHRARMADARS